MYEKTYPSKRFNITLEFLKKHISTNETIFDLGVPNPFSKIMVENKYTVINTKGEDLDTNQTALREENYDVFTGFQIVDRVKFTHPVKKIGFRPLLRWFTPRYYLVYAERNPKI